MPSKFKRSQIQLTDLVSTALATDASGNIVAGVAGGDMLKSENLSGLANNATARTNIGLGNVDNTSDADKPVSTAQAAAISLKANIASPTFTGTVWGITASMVGAPSGSGTSSGNNTGDQTSIVGISGTKAQFDTAVTDGNFMYIGDAPTAHTHISTEITDFNSASRAQTEAELVAGTNITITPSGSGATRQLTIASTGGGGSPFATDIVINGLTAGRGGGNSAGNASFGQLSLNSNTTGVGNTACGGQTMRFNTLGSYNTAVGSLSLQTNVSGDENTAMWAFTLQNATSRNNTAFGSWAGSSVTTGLESTFLGSGADTSLAWVQNSTAIGNGAVVSASNQVVIGNASVTSTTLRGAVTATSFNGVALTTAGGTTNFLRADGTYAAPVSGTPTFNGVSCYKSASTNYTTTDTAVTFTTEEFDTNSYHDNSTNTSRFTAPSTGYYLFSWKRIDDLFSGSGVQTQMKVKKNWSAFLTGTDEAYNVWTSVGYQDPYPIYNELKVSLTSGDYLELFAFATANTTVAYSGIRVQMQYLGS